MQQDYSSASAFFKKEQVVGLCGCPPLFLFAHGGDFCGWNGAAEEKSLSEGAAKFAQVGPLFLGFDAFGQRAHFEVARELDDGGDDAGVFFAVRQITHKGAVDFQGLDGHVFEAIE